MIAKNKKCKYEGCKSTKIWSKGFCRFHTPKTPLKSSNKLLKKSGNIKKISERGLVVKEKKKEYTILQTQMFLEIWSKNPHICQSCNKYLGEEPLNLYFDHLIEKSGRKDLALIKENIFICCGDCHSRKTNGFPTEKHKKAIEEAKIKYGK